MKRLVSLLVLAGVVGCTTDAIDSESSPSTPASDDVSEAAAPTATPSSTGLSFAQYHSQADIHTYLTSMATQHPSFVSFATLGSSRQGREIAYIVVSNKDATTVPALYFNGTHHGDEWSSTESILGFADYLIAHHDEPAVSAILDAYAVYLQPLVNPDGHLAKTREDSTGTDPNRDYAYPERTDAASFKVPEIKLVKDLVDRIKPRAAAAYHSGIEEVLWPWCYTGDASTDDALLSSSGRTAAEAMGFDRYLQSYDDYASTGEFIDYAYWKYKTVALTFEVSIVKTPSASQLDGIVQSSVKGALAFVDAIAKADAGTIATPGQTLTLHPRASYGASGKRTTPRLE